MYAMEEKMLKVMSDPGFKGFMGEHPVHDAVAHAFLAVFRAGGTLRDLPFLVFTGRNAGSEVEKSLASDALFG